MKIKFSYKNLSTQEKGFVKQYCSSNQKLDKVEQLVDKLNPDASLEIRTEKFVKKSAYKVSFILARPLHIFVSEDDHTLHEAIDLAKDKLLARLRKIRSKKKYVS